MASCDVGYVGAPPTLLLTHSLTFSSTHTITSSFTPSLTPSLMVFQIFVSGCGNTKNITVPEECDVSTLFDLVASELQVPNEHFYLINGTNCLNQTSPTTLLSSQNIGNASTIGVKMRIKGGIDFQHREGSKIGSGGQLSESQAAMERKERLRKLALETIDITKDPYIMKNHLGTFECKLCLTLHNNEGNYLAHTQGKRHQVIFISHYHPSLTHSLTHSYGMHHLHFIIPFYRIVI